MTTQNAYYLEMLSILGINETELTKAIYSDWLTKNKSLVELNLALITCCR